MQYIGHVSFTGHIGYTGHAGYAEGMCGTRGSEDTQGIYRGYRGAWKTIRTAFGRFGWHLLQIYDRSIPNAGTPDKQGERVITVGL